MALPQSGPLAFSIVTPFFAHIGFFADCAKSIAALAAKTAQPFEWVMVNDDPSIANDTLLNSIPKAIHDRVRVVSDGKNHGITRALDRGISTAANTWIVLLDCDDMLESDALDALSSAIEEAPECRYFSSLMIDIDDKGKELRRRRAHHELVDAFEAGMVGGHMIAFRRDLYEDLGGFDPRFSGVQDYDFLLRAAAREQIRRIPRHLYRYRWHSNTQSVSRIARQEQLTNAVRTAFLNETMGLVAKRVMRPALPDCPEIFCVMRTQGNRIDLLAAALESVRAQALPTTPCIVVHGDRETVDFVRQQLPAELSEEHCDRPAIILQAGELDRRRGYPCNVALDHLKANASRYDLLCFLDDDDHFLPDFAERLTRLIKLTGVDMAYGMANALPKNGEPYVQHEPRPWHSILAGNFITFNGFLVRVDAVLEAGVTFAEDMHYLEDHDFLVQLLGAGVRAVPLTEVVSEYRLIGDGNAWDKQDPKHFRSCARKVRQRAEEAARTLSRDTFWADILAFPAQDRSAFDEVEVGLLLRSRDMLK
ncbi:glycosyltransferase [Rhizobium sp. P32RR-XVIII]|uniref:glycosyltransferase n=1 Tax=Rhizobium sp. P32RR-XVIII TaxID=2726738 RepID=UPI0014571C86|nr:glycosyltransferase [Rhizobium sp. P32RR-XVIII]